MHGICFREDFAVDVVALEEVDEEVGKEMEVEKEVDDSTGFEFSWMLSRRKGTLFFATHFFSIKSCFASGLTFPPLPLPLPLLTVPAEETPLSDSLVSAE